MESIAHPHHLVCTIASLGYGGAQRALVNMVNKWAELRTFDITLIVHEAESVPAYPLHPDVKVQWLDIVGKTVGVFDKILTNISRIRKLRKALLASKPDVVLSFQDVTNVMTLLAMTGRQVPVVCSERIHPAHHQIGRMWEILRRFTYPKASAVVVQGQGIADWFQSNIKTVVIPNSVPRPKALSDVPASGDRKTLLSVGRLHQQKGVDILLKAFAGISETHSDWDVCILGEGEGRSELESMIVSLGLEGRVLLPGNVSDVSERYYTSDAFVLPSRFEGFPNVLVEAMAHGLPCLATDCPGAVRDIVRDGENGLLAAPDNVNDLASKLGDLLESEGLRKRLGRAAQSVVEEFDEQRVLGLWEDLFKSLVDSRKGAA